MCASLLRPPNTWSSDSLSIHLSFALITFASSLLSSPLLLHARLPSPHFLLSKFISLQVPSPFFSPSSRSFPAVHLYRRSLPNAVRLTTLFPFKIKIIKSAAKWERVCCWRHHGSALMFYFSAIVSTSTHRSQTTVAHTRTQSHTYSQFTHSHSTSHLLPPSSSPYSYSKHKDRFDTLSSTVLGLISYHPTTAFFTVDLTHFSSSFPSLSSALFF